MTDLLLIVRGSVINGLADNCQYAAHIGDSLPVKLFTCTVTSCNTKHVVTIQRGRSEEHVD